MNVRWRRWALVPVAALGLAAGYASRPADDVAARADAGASGAAEPGVVSNAARGGDARLVVRRRPPASPLLVPGTLDYNPAAAAMALELSSREVFESETRDPRFAERRERVVGEYMRDMLATHGPGIELLGVECRSGSCRAVVEAPDDDWSRSLLYYMAWGTLTDVEQVDQRGGRITYEVTTLMNHDLLDHDRYERLLASWRASKDQELPWLREQQRTR